MSISETETYAAVQQFKMKLTRRSGRDVGLLQCLIVSAKAARQQMLVDAASTGGWETIVCGDAPSALRCLSRVFVRLALVDLEKPAPGELRQVVEKLAATSGVLVIVCGNEDDIQEEIWARQLGAWLYLPGVEGAGVSVLCDEARQITEQMAAAVSSNGHQANGHHTNGHHTNSAETSQRHAQ